MAACIEEIKRVEAEAAAKGEQPKFTHLTHPPRSKNIVHCDQVKQTFNRMYFFSL